MESNRKERFDWKEKEICGRCKEKERKVGEFLRG
jgi:hypothetical protein